MRSRANAQVNLQRRHFEAIARIIAGTNYVGFSDDQRNTLAIHFAKLLSRTNNNFQFDKFVQWANGDERSESDMVREQKAANKAKRLAEREAKAKAKAEKLANSPLFSLQDIEKANRLVDKLGG